MQTFRKVAALVAAVFAAASIAAAEPPAIPKTNPVRIIKDGEGIQVKAGGFADFTVEVPTGPKVTVLARISPAPVQRAEGLPAGRFIFAGKEDTTYAVQVTIIDFDKGTAKEQDVSVKFGKGTLVVPPGPVTPPGPVVPPAPVVVVPPELTAAVSSAWTKETEAERTKTAKLAQAFRDAASITSRPDLTTRKQLAAAAREIGDAACGESGLLLTRRAIGDWLNKTVGQLDQPLTDALRKQYATAYTQAAAALDPLAK